MKGTRLMTILYGAFEKLGPPNKVKEQPLEQRIAPVVDITNIARLQEYNQVASSLKEFGKVTRLKDAIIAEQVSSSDQAIRDLGKSISQLDEYIATIDLKEIKRGKFISSFRNYYKTIRKRQNIAVPIKNILDELYKETEGFVSQDDYRNIEEAINWTIKHDMLMQAYPLAEEYIISRFYDMFIDIKPSLLSKKDFRVFVSDILGAPEEDFKNRNWIRNAALYPEVADEIADDPLVREIRPMYEPLRLSRNSLAHGNGVIKYKELKKGIPNIIKCIKYLNAEYEHYASTESILKNYNGKE